MLARSSVRFLPITVLRRTVSSTPYTAVSRLAKASPVSPLCTVARCQSTTTAQHDEPPKQQQTPPPPPPPGNKPRSLAELLGLLLGAAVFPLSVYTLNRMDEYFRDPPKLPESLSGSSSNSSTDAAPDFTSGGGGVAGGANAVKMTTRPQLGGPFEMTRSSDRKLIRESELFLGHWTLLYFGFANCAEICPNTMTFIRDVMKASDQSFAAPPPALQKKGEFSKSDVEVPSAAQTLQACFVSVDHNRDSPKNVSQFLKPFNDTLTPFSKLQDVRVVSKDRIQADAKRVRVEGLTGTKAQIVEATRQWRVYFSSYDETQDETDAREAKGVTAPDPLEKTYQLDHSSAIYLVGPDGKMKDFFFREIGVKDTVERLGMHFQNVYGIND